SIKQKELTINVSCSSPRSTPFFKRSLTDEQRAAVGFLEMKLARFDAPKEGPRRSLQKPSGFVGRNHLRLRRAIDTPDLARAAQAKRRSLALLDGDLCFGFGPLHFLKSGRPQPTFSRQPCAPIAAHFGGKRSESP